MRCPSCGSIYYVKNGKKNGKQRYRCYDCGCNYTQDTWKGYTPKEIKVKQKAVKLFLEGNSSRDIKKETNIPDRTVLSWIRLIIRNISEIDQIKNEFDFQTDDLNRLESLNKAIKDQKMVHPLSIDQLRSLKGKHLIAILLLLRHRPKKRNRPKNAPQERCSEIVKRKSIKDGELFTVPARVKIGNRKVKRHFY